MLLTSVSFPSSDNLENKVWGQDFGFHMMKAYYKKEYVWKELLLQLLYKWVSALCTSHCIYKIYYIYFTRYYDYIMHGSHLEQMNGLVLNREYSQSPPVQVNALVVRQVDLVAFELFCVAEHSVVESDNVKWVIFQRLLAWQQGLVVLVNIPVAKWKSSISLLGGLLWINRTTDLGYGSSGR